VQCPYQELAAHPLPRSAVHVRILPVHEPAPGGDV
jgi:hypothetical protein